jgi:hypothetical protein
MQIKNQRARGMRKNARYYNGRRLGLSRDSCAILMRISRESVMRGQKKKLPTRGSGFRAQASTGQGQLAACTPRSATKCEACGKLDVDVRTAK